MEIKIKSSKEKYPKFNFEVDYILSELNRNNRLNEIQKQVFLDLSKNAKGDVFKYAGFQFRSFKRILENYNSSNKSPTGTIICAGTGSGKQNHFIFLHF